MSRKDVFLDHLPAQDDFYNAQERAVAFIAGLGTGKTHVASDWILEGAVSHPRANHGIFSNTYPQLTAGTLDTFYQRCEHWDLRYVPRVRDLHQIFLPDIGAKIDVRSIDRPILFKSLEFSRVWIDEAQAWSKDAYDKVLGRLRGTSRQRRLYPHMPQQIRLTANPPHTFEHWLYDLTHIDDPATGLPPIRMITATTFDNPFLPQEYIDSLLGSYDPDIAEAELYGKFIELGRGRALRRFMRAKHVLSEREALERGLPPLRFDPFLPLCWSHDFNLDPLCSVLFQWRKVNVNGYQAVVMYVIDEIRIEGALITDAVKALFDRPAALEIARRNGIILYGDFAGFQGNRQTGVSDWAALRAELARHNLHGDSKVPNSGNPDRAMRWAAGNRMLEDARGNIGLVMHERCKYTAMDCTRMYFKPGTTEVEILKAKPGEIIPPSKKLTHLGDALTYPIAYEHPVIEY